MQQPVYHPIARPAQRVERPESLLDTFRRRYGDEHPLTRRIQEQLDRARVEEGGRP